MIRTSPFYPIRIRYFLMLFPLLLGNPGVAYAIQDLEFNQSIRPLLSENCFACHGPDSETREAGLRLDQRQEAVESEVIVPGDPDASLLIERVNSSDPDLIMPPADSGKKLNEEQKKRLSAWIRQGAQYQRHWAFEPVPKRVPIPEAGEGWSRQSLDHFVAKTHQQRGLAANPEVERGLWLRRVTFDLTGLPPTLEQWDAFLKDDSPDAYEKVVQRLLESPAYGERMANMWLDVARYADTFGYQSDVEMNVWPWRDWVINAFNRNMPYDVFLTEQLAGDLLPDATMEQKLATAFNRLHRQTNEGGSVAEEFRVSGIADRTTTAGTAFLGLTLECCRCHDHKFDPLSQKEFYQLAAYFSDIDEFGLYSHFTRATPSPSLLLYQGDQKQKHEEALQNVDQLEHKWQEVKQRVREEVAAKYDPEKLERIAVPKPDFQMPLEGSDSGVVGNATRCDGDNAIGCPEAPVFGRTSPFTYSLWVKPGLRQERMLVLHQSRAAEDSGFRGLQLTIDNGHPQFSMIHFWPGNAVRIRATQDIPEDQWSHLAVTHDGSGSAAGLRLLVNGRPADVTVVRDKLTLDIRHRREWGDAEAGGIRLALGARFRDIGFRDGLVDDLQVFNRPLTNLEVQALYLTVRPEDWPMDPEQWIDHQVATHPEVVEALATLNSARQVEDELVTSVRQIMTMHHDEQAMPTHVLHRGEYTQPGEKVQPATPELTGLVQASGTDRLSLARWMTQPDHPLTSRVIVNRMWYLFFGRGLVATLEDFGSQGAPPSHPELLDFLARDLVEHDWDLHHLCRQIVLSATYRQSSHATAQDYEEDPDNVWLARGPSHRLSAEQWRDAMLASSGLLVQKLGGPSVKPYQPDGLWRESGTGKHYQPSTGEGLYRRSLYTFWRRTAPPPSMLIMDATSRESCTPRRELTTTPLQALVFLNDPQAIEASRALAEILFQQHGEAQDLNERWTELYIRLISRKPTKQELTIVNRLYQQQIEYFQAEPGRATEFLGVGQRPPASEIEPATLAATTIVVQTLYAYDETIMLR